jgi:hypothetical protein
MQTTSEMVWQHQSGDRYRQLLVPAHRRRIETIFRDRLNSTTQPTFELPKRFHHDE